MANILLDNFNQRMSALKSDKRQRFLHGIYKQLVESNKGKQTIGEYRTVFGQADGEIRRNNQDQRYVSYHPESHERIELVVRIADALNQYGMENHSDRLLQQERRTGTYQRWKHTLSELEKLDPELKDGVGLHFLISGIQLVVGDARHEGPFSTSIILDEGSHGKEDNLYEARPFFEGRHLNQDGLHNEEIVGSLSLENALSLAQAALSQDRTKYDAAFQRVYG